ncbi:hypothetical protein ACFPDQ_03930 [Pseudofrancisella aestuarii]|uniref:DUF2913 family protein n=1 Tax=Pseudofrancisella aestuarii TaxID=2670347 RepID=A0ABV9TBB4_9GAMM|nr:hypothetical protein [Pseudofrancisella aestuarii]
MDIENVDEEELKKDFLLSELFNLAWKGGLQRSNTYQEGKIGEKERLKIKLFVKKIIDGHISDYQKDSIELDEKNHFELIKTISSETTNKFKDRLIVNKGFCIGVSQKVLNLYLKYLWCLGEIKEPPHCPLDGIVLGELKRISKDRCFDIKWTQLEKIEKYNDVIKKAKKVIAEKYNKTLSTWELKFWNSKI